MIIAGDGQTSTQAKLYLILLQYYKIKARCWFKIAICGDILHPRVHSNIKLLRKFVCEVRVLTAPTLMPNGFEQFMAEKFQVQVFNDLERQ